jgi:hypothetical protein
MWKFQSIAPGMFNVVTDLLLFLYPFPIIFMANVPSSLRYCLLFIFSLWGFVTASAIVRVVLMTTMNFSEQQNLYAYTFASLSVLIIQA